MKIEIWSDIVCPWCYIGKRRFERALASFAHRDEVRVEWRSFELDPRAPVAFEGSLEEHLAKKYRVDLGQARAMMSRVTQAAAEEGLAFDFSSARGGNTFDAHRLLHLAASLGLGDVAKERLLKAYFCEGLSPSDAEALTASAVEVGLPQDAVTEVLEGDAFADAVRADESRAKALQIHGVPYFLIEDRWGVSGAQTPETLRMVLERAHAELSPPPPESADACGPEGCEVPVSARVH